VSNELKGRVAHEVGNITLPAGEEVIEAEDLPPLIQEALAEM
jgi:hypothetical protein